MRAGRLRWKQNPPKFKLNNKKKKTQSTCFWNIGESSSLMKAVIGLSFSVGEGGRYLAKSGKAKQWSTLGSWTIGSDRLKVILFYY